VSKLDRSRDFAEIYGVADDGAAFTQDGKRFNGTGEEITAEGFDVPESLMPANKRGRKPKAEIDLA
jgi:hypothetical protein